MRMFWQPVYLAQDLLPGRAKPIRIMSEDYTLYRGESGTPSVIAFRCAHRGMQLSPGWVEGDCIRCFYHGWKYDGSGQCVEQPAEPKSFAEKVKIAGYPTREYLGLIFAYLGEGDPPTLPRYPDFEDFEGTLDHDINIRQCNFFQSLENYGDASHVGFVHRDGPGSFDGRTDSPVIRAAESEWGFTCHAKRPSGSERITQVGMPNVLHLGGGIPEDPEIGGARDNLTWEVPIDDGSNIQFRVFAVRIPKEKVPRYLDRRSARLATMKTPNEELARDILAGKKRLDEVDPETTHYVHLEDDVAQMGQGPIADRAQDHLGRSDTGLIMLRKLWKRELKALAEGQPLKQWVYDPESLPTSTYFHINQNAYPQNND